MKGRPRQLSSLWRAALFFIGGCFVTYVGLQWHILDINVEVHIPELLATVFAAIVGLYVADTIQRNLTRSQNQYSFIGVKLDVLWSAFSKHANTLRTTNLVPLGTVTGFQKGALESIEYLLNIFEAYGLDTAALQELENLLDGLETTLTNLPMGGNNIIDFTAQQPAIDSVLANTHRTFAKILQQIHRL